MVSGQGLVVHKAPPADEDRNAPELIELAEPLLDAPREDEGDTQGVGAQAPAGAGSTGGDMDMKKMSDPSGLKK